MVERFADRKSWASDSRRELLNDESTVRFLVTPAMMSLSAMGLVGATCLAFLARALTNACWRWMRARSLSGYS